MQYISQVALDSIVFTAWIHEIDVSKKGFTKDFQLGLGAIKKTLSLFTPERIKQEENAAKELVQEEIVKEQIAQKYKTANKVTKSVLGIKRTSIPLTFKAQNLKDYEQREKEIYVPAAVAA